MKTRAEIYGSEASSLLQEVSMYPGILEGQLSRFHPGKGEAVRNLLAYLKKQGRIMQAESGGFYPYGECPRAPDGGMVKAVWVLLDFIGQAEFHSPADFPVKLTFFSGGELYEVVYVAGGQEALIAHALQQDKKGGGRRIVLVDGPQQIQLLDFPGIAGFCTVDPAGKVSYYRKG